MQIYTYSAEYVCAMTVSYISVLHIKASVGYLCQLCLQLAITFIGHHKKGKGEGSRSSINHGDKSDHAKIVARDR